MDDLEPLYRRAVYVVDDGEVNFTIRLGQENAELTQYLTALKIRSWAFLTAYNPNSLPAAPAQNEARQADLIRLIEIQGYAYLNGYGTGDNWPPEASIFIAEIPAEKALDLAREFNQSAILYGTIGAEPDLLWCRSRAIS